MPSDHTNYPIPTDEAERLKTLLDLHLLDTAPDQQLDHITQLVSRLFDMPIVLVSLVDKDRQWFKSCVGLDDAQTPREQAFCNYTILDDEGFEVTDSHEDSRFIDNSLVTGGPKIRYYLGMPVHVFGKRIGTLCLIDTKPRPAASESDRETLKDFAQLVAREIEIRETLRQTLEAVKDSLNFA